MTASKGWDKDVQNIADQLVFGVGFERGVRYVGELADLVMEVRAHLSRYEALEKACVAMQAANYGKGEFVDEAWDHYDAMCAALASDPQTEGEQK